MIFTKLKYTFDTWISIVLFLIFVKFMFIFDKFLSILSKLKFTSIWGLLLHAFVCVCVAMYILGVVLLIFHSTWIFTILKMGLILFSVLIWCDFFFIKFSVVFISFTLSLSFIFRSRSFSYRSRSLFSHLLAATTSRSHHILWQFLFFFLLHYERANKNACFRSDKLH